MPSSAFSSFSQNNTIMTYNVMFVIYNQNDIDFLINKYYVILYVITIVINTIIKITERLASEKGC